ncbi:hypothetical protein, partial [Helicobacter sp. 11S02629-2]|uniref:hypothetical protein n=1 Tax=Helicobacter sp. 11S02629-2 TaxID=1476195 RepID=UPI0015D9E999
GDEVDISQDIKLTAMQEKSQVSIKAFCQTNKITYAQVANCTNLSTKTLKRAGQDKDLSEQSKALLETFIKTYNFALTKKEKEEPKDDFSTKLDNLKSEEILSYINDFCAKNNINYNTLSLNLNMSYGFIAHLTHTKKISKAMRGLILRYFEILEMKKALSLC